MSTIYNFSAGPAVLPKSVLEQARDEMVDWHGTGMSIMEMSHRGKDFTAIAHQAEADLRELLAIPENYKVLFLQGGATAQFAMVPMNLLRGKAGADYIDTGIWSDKAIKEARRYAQVNVAASSADHAYTYAPGQTAWQLDSNAAYVHYTPNETIGGVEFHWTPEVGNVPLVADMSSNVLSKPIDVSRFGVIYAGAQKNIGPAGLTIAIVREDLMGEAMPRTPTLYDYKVQADNGSMYNTPPTYAIYIAGLVFQLLKREGGLAAMEQRNIAKAKLLYDYLDASDFYHNPVAPENRSRMNVPFTLSNPALDAAFLQGAQQQGLLQLKGHALVGGMRASIYNAMPLEGVQALVNYMQDFVKKQG
ncbi:3-phosphoserine/phosphohydroxythreonine transaminase [Sulfuriferula nivalis]|uniref:Phosphoserine aminotransferase n=1 Tax=Sulfuriferula nivalis TaxID=2675298 RepID=A0A809S8P1_9PROT|nr:3-phosphoserine/phosphohydroxythreonine transaminase [Sulfuriferula nivalis]BBP00673.1 phosphoserine aminotransferase [Sulfuriferula nivalis]